MFLYALSLIGAVVGAWLLALLLRPDHHGDLARIAEISATREAR